MSNEQKTRELSQEEVNAMTPAELNNALMVAVKIEGKVLVRDKDGNPKYDNPERAGEYGEETLGDLS